MVEIKQELYRWCSAQVKGRTAIAEEAMQHAQASANEETKSSAGDKYETGRAMMHLEKEKLTMQLSEVSKMKKALNFIIPDKLSSKVELGSLVTTEKAKYYISVSLGQIKLQEEIFFAISPASPIGQAMLGKKQGESFEFAGRKSIITDLC